MFYTASGTGKPALPDEVKSALSDTTIFTCSYHLWEVIQAINTIRVTLVFDTALIAATWGIEAFVSLVVQNLIAAAVFIRVRPYIQDTAAKVSQDTEVLEIAQVVNWVKVR